MSNDGPTIATGIPAGTKATGGGRVDFEVDKFDQLIEVKGQRHWWSRSTLCPCVGNAQTDQPDPTCALCNGRSWYYFLPDLRLSADGKDPGGNAVEISEAGDAVGIKVLITSISSSPEDYEKFGRWIPGTGKATTQSRNRLSWRDVFVARDVTQNHTQLLTADGTAVIPITGLRSTNGLNTAVASVAILRSLTTNYTEGADFRINPSGTIGWLGGAEPDVGTRLTIHYGFYPRWVAMDSPHPTRDTFVQGKAGDLFTRLPSNTTVKLDFLADKVVVA